MEQRKKFDKAFREQVALRILAQESTVGETAKELNVHYTTVRDWVRTYKRDGESSFPGSAVILRLKMTRCANCESNWQT